MTTPFYAFKYMKVAAQGIARTKRVRAATVMHFYGAPKGAQVALSCRVGLVAQYFAPNSKHGTVAAKLVACCDARACIIAWRYHFIYFSSV
jgi:hypothetical protein